MSKPVSLLVIALWSMLTLVACSQNPRSDARSRYNDGIAWMASGDLDDAEDSFTEARNTAGGDQMVRYSAAFNLGLVHVRRADELELSEPKDSLQELAQARHWFQDAARVRSDDEDARANLQLVDRKIQVLSDQINQGDNKLEVQLDAAIESERALRDQVRVLMEEVKAAKMEADPIEFRKAFNALAVQERVLMAKVGTVSDLAADELAGLDGQVEEEMEQQDRIRQIQLRNVDGYLQSGRVAIDDTRRALRKLDPTMSHSRATAALADLKRAREQLLDPVTALKAVAQDQQLLLQHTDAKMNLAGQELVMPGEAPTKSRIPAWLSNEHLADRQEDALERASQVMAQFQAAANAPPPVDPSAVDPQTARSLEMAGKALPFLVASVAAMTIAHTKLQEESLDGALQQETEAMRQLLRAIEHFSDLRNLIELTYQEELGVVALLDPSAEGDALAKMSTEERTKEGNQASSRNVDRLDRMRALIAEELAQAKAKQGEQASPEELQSVEQTFAMAETHRAAAEGSLRTLVELFVAIEANEEIVPDAKSPLELAVDGQTSLEELRRIFYTIIEHLKELHRDQSETYDSTGTIAGEDDAQRPMTMPPVVAAQTKHRLLAEALASALEKQADAAAGSEDPKAAQEAQKFASAAVEVRAAQDAMKTASAGLDEALAQLDTLSADLSPILEDQPKAIAHLLAAIEILEPPKEDQQDEDQQDKDQQDEDQPEPKEDEMTKEQAEKRLQEIRDREAQRQKEREDAQRVQSGGVDKDW